MVFEDEGGVGVGGVRGGVENGVVGGAAGDGEAEWGGIAEGENEVVVGDGKVL